MNRFTNLRTEHKYFCTFIPPFILENLEKVGVEDATLTIHQDITSRKERASELKFLQELSREQLRKD